MGYGEPDGGDGEMSGGLAPEGGGEATVEGGGREQNPTLLHTWTLPIGKHQNQPISIGKFH